MKRIRLYIIIITAFMLAWAGQAQAQLIVKGTVLDSSRSYPIEAVTILATNGRGAVTNNNGQYQIEVGEKDSIWFSYLGKPTMKFPVAKIADLSQFDLALKINIPVLAEIKIRPRNYRQDSLQNRLDYAKVFNFQKPNFESMTSVGPMGAGIDVNELIRAFQFRKNRSTLKFQERLLQQEQDKYVEHRFNKALVKRLTGLEGEELERFVRIYRPPFEFTASANDYTFQTYIKSAYQMYKNQGQKGF